MKDLAEELIISESEVSESLNRSAVAGLIDKEKRKVSRQALLQFLQYGLRYVFPQELGKSVRGLATAHSAPPLNAVIVSEEKVVWPYAKGTDRGHALEPLYATVVEASLQDKALYELLALTETLRIGRAREKELAVQLLKERL